MYRTRVLATTVDRGVVAKQSVPMIDLEASDHGGISPPATFVREIIPTPDGNASS